MTRTASDIATEEFYTWEKRGRGWDMYEMPVELEPPYIPFTYHYYPQQSNYINDGKKPKLLGKFINWLIQPQKTIEVQPEPIFEPPFLFNCKEPLTIYSISLPKGYKVEHSDCEQLLVSLSYSTYPISFEIIGSLESITLQFVSRKSDALHVYSQILAYFPEAIVIVQKDSIEEALEVKGFLSITDFGLEQEFMRPVATLDNLKVDPFVRLFGTFEQLQPDEYVVIQVLFQGTVNPWQRSIIRSVTDSDGSSFFIDAPEMITLAQEKVKYPLYGVCMKVMGVSTDSERSELLTDIAQKSFVRIYTSPYNSVVPLRTPAYSLQDKVDDMLLRQSHRQGMLINSRELLPLIHFPTPSVVTKKLHQGHRKTKAAPKVTEGHQLSIGANEYAGVTKEITLSSSQRLKHTHIIGATGTGKSTLLESMVVQDIQHGNGIAVLDPHGDLIDSIISRIPENRINDCIIVDPSDPDYAIGFNILSANTEIEKEILSSDLVASFKRLSTSWGDQMNSVLGNAILAFLESTEGGTLADLRRFLIEKPYRNQFLQTVLDSNVKYYWQKEYPLLKSSSIGSILTRLDTFLRPKPIRYMVAQKGTLDFEQILDTNKILLVKLSQGLIGNENSYLLGSFFVTKIYQAAMARQIKAKESRNNFYTYIDEFQNFITPSMSQILSGARKYHLGLILAHQDMQQLVKYDAELASSITANAGTRICFRLGDTDAKRFASGMSHFEANDLENLNTGQAIARIERPDYDFSLTTLPLSPLNQEYAQETSKAVIDYSRGRYGVDKNDVEQYLATNIEGIPIIEDQLETTPQWKTPPPPPLKELTEELVAETKEKLKVQKEDTEHRQLQNYIKKMAEARGYTARLEEPIVGGQDRVDVHIEREGRRIACEICCTTNANWEIHNIHKCIEVGYDLVVSCSSNQKTLENISEKVKLEISNKNQEKIFICTPDAFISLLDAEIAKEATTEKRIKGYRVKVEYNPISEKELKQKKAIVSKAFLNKTKDKK
ncbi:MAG: type IV secretion system DNA-binding domain-containing protein [Chitinophagales bacterium]|nr:type IV secretion system DNA-binding domain-containing protein [Chitinophagaceae bacterium]MCB9064087.1 type IV secretion system DNA-binding domain-containing protein [Chitinophagales bacterium]